MNKALIAAALALSFIALPGMSYAGPNTGTSVQIAPDGGYHWVYRGGPKATPSWEK